MAILSRKYEPHSQTNIEHFSFQILLGLNLYGLDYSVTGGSHILGHQYLDILATYKPKFSYDDVSKEHFFEYK